MKKFAVLFICVSFLLFFYIKKDFFNLKKNEETSTQPILRAVTSSPSLKQNSTSSKPSISRLPAGERTIKDFLPLKIAPELRRRWEQKIVDEDDRYITSQLYFDGRKLEEYFYKWEKQESGDLFLVAGELPEASKIAASFPSKLKQSQKIDALLYGKGKLLSSREVWIIDSSGTIIPFLKIEVQRSEQLKKTTGHEYWMFDLSKDKVRQTIQADRY